MSDRFKRWLKGFHKFSCSNVFNFWFNLFFLFITCLVIIFIDDPFSVSLYAAALIVSAFLSSVIGLFDFFYRCFHD